MWKTLAFSLGVIYIKNASKLSFEELYRNANKLELKKWGETVYTKVQEFEEEWLANEVRPQIIEVFPQIPPSAKPGAQTMPRLTRKVYNLVFKKRIRHFTLE